jgi:peptidoglycan/xylan/chitin deacetylase (PgdA/CDA1 family)
VLARRERATALISGRRCSFRSSACGGRKGRSILLLHDGDGYDAEGDRLQTAEALPSIIEGLRARGLRFATLRD